MDFLGIAAGFVLGFLASWLFWKSQLMIKPRFAISRQVAVMQSSKHPRTQFYQIKIVNLSSRSIINMTATIGIHEINEDNRGPTSATSHKFCPR